MDMNSSSSTTVIGAARYGRSSSVERLIAEGHPVDAHDNRGWRATHEAASRGDIDCLKILLKHKDTDLSVKTFDGATALLVAVRKKQLEAVKFLLEKKCDLNVPDAMQCFPLYEAVQNSDLPCIKVLIEHGAHVDCKSYCGTTPLHEVIQKTEGASEIVDYLLKHNASVKIQEDNGITPVFAASQFGKYELLDKMLTSLPDREVRKWVVNRCAHDGASPLYLAAQGGHLRCVKLLLNHGANPDLMTREPVALPLHAALEFKRLECFKILYPLTDLRLLSECSASLFDSSLPHKDGECTECLLDLGHDPNAIHWFHSGERFQPKALKFSRCVYLYRRKVTPLGALTFYEYPIENAHLLLERGVNANPETILDVPPLLMALDRRNLSLVQLLISYGAAINLSHPIIAGNMALIVCLAYWKGLTMVLKYGACPNTCFTEPKWDLNPNNTLKGNNGCDIDTSGYDIYDKKLVKKVFRTQPLSFHETLSGARIRMASSKLSVGQVLYRMATFSTCSMISPNLEQYMDSKEEWKRLSKIFENPRSLMHLCRQNIRQRLGPRRLMGEDQTRNMLPLPVIVLDYLFYKDLDY